MSSSLPYCDIGYSTHYVTDWSNCTLCDCIYQNKYRIPYVGCCSDGSGNLSSTVSSLRQCSIRTSDIELSPCDPGTWNCTEIAKSSLNRGIISWTPWQEKWCKPESQTITFRVGWPVRLSNSLQRVKFIEENHNQTCPTAWPFSLSPCRKLKRRVQRTRVRIEGSSGNDQPIGYSIPHEEIISPDNWNLTTVPRNITRIITRDGCSVNNPLYGYNLSSISDTSSGGGSSATLQNTTISTISLPPTYDEIISSDNRNLTTVPRNTTTTIIRTTTTEVNPIALPSANVNGIPPPSYDMLFETGARPAELPENKSPPVYLPGNERPPSYLNA